ncbi:hypothetical protein LZP69_09060 [Shewanella sp. AS1]|uniref:hypothetical protein n=1 Tax=Shewanella sp. AS1 TaxID=2907626 RepID=UPI001F244928|nr:hypothetical protein [Shewanella sp. AS1]MCE9679322.1 hypothetical protein [Shewanella sp. AS1]
MNDVGKSLTPKMAQRIVDEVIHNHALLSDVASRFGVSDEIVSQLIRQNEKQNGSAGRFRIETDRVAQQLNLLMRGFKLRRH